MDKTTPALGRTAAAQTFDEAVTAHKRGDYATALLGFRSLAELGHSEAQFNLGVMCLKGDGVPRDAAEAARWFCLAAEQGDAEAQRKLGDLYRRGDGVSQDTAEAARWYRHAADQGDTLAQFNLGVMHYGSDGVSQDDAEAVRWFRRAAELGHAESRINLGVAYHNGRGVPQDFVQSHMWLDLAVFRLSGADGHEDGHERAVEFRDKVAALLMPAELVRARRLAQEWRPGSDAFDEAVTAHKRGDYAAALRVFRSLAELGHAEARLNLGVMYYNGRGVPQDFVQAHMWLNLVASRLSGSGDALRDLAVEFRDKAAALLTPAELARSQFDLGLMYRLGDGVPRDAAEAVRWFRLAAEQGHAEAQFNLGSMYSRGEGVSRNAAKAVRWFRGAAEQGHAKAQFNLGSMYRLGKGVPQDFVQAHMWLDLAVSHLPGLDDAWRENAAELRDSVAARLTPEELDRARRLARDWRPAVSEAGSDAPAAGE